MPKANEVLDSNVVVQIVEAPKAEYVLQIVESKQIDQVVELFSDGEATIAEGDDDLQKSALILGKVLMPDAGVPCTYAKWNVIRSTWLRKYAGFNPHASEDTAQKAWERQVRRVQKEMPDVKKPSAPSKAAVAVSEKRAKQKAELEAMLDSQLADRLAAYKANDNFTEANKVKAEIKRREKEANAGIEEEVKSAREVVIKQIKLCGDLDLLNQISDMLPSLPIATM
jgi:flagellar biosynthesis GTPase FlhF